MRDYLNARGMASQERAYLAPPCPEPEWVECAWCGGELLDEDATEDGNWFCDDYCKDAYNNPEVE